MTPDDPDAGAQPAEEALRGLLVGQQSPSEPAGSRPARRGLHALVVPSAVGTAHVARTLLVAGRLAARGHRVTFGYGGNSAPIADAGYEVHRVHDVLAAPQEDIYGAWTRDDAEWAATDLVALCRELRPDIVIADLHPLVTIAARQARVRSLGLLSAGFTPDAAGLTGATGTTLTLARWGLAARTALLARPFSATARRRGQRDRETLAGVLRGDSTMATELASFAGPVGGARCSGPLFWDEPGSAPPPPPPGVTRVYSTIGTTGDPALLELAIAAFAGRPGLQLVLTSGREADPPGVPDDVVAARTMPGSQVLRHARLVVHAGGSGTTYQALAAGVPMIVVPHVAGQDVQARLVQRHGVGIAYRMDRLDVQRLRLGAAEVLTHGAYRQRAREFARELASVDGPNAIADEAERLTTRPTPVVPE